MSRIQVGDTVAFRREVARTCNSSRMAQFRATVTEVCGAWVFLQEASGGAKVMPVTNMCKVAQNGVILEIV